MSEILLPRIARQGTVCRISSNKVDKLESIELRSLSSMRVSNRIIPPSEQALQLARQLSLQQALLLSVLALKLARRKHTQQYFTIL